MVNETESFHERLNRIQRVRRRNRGGMGFVIHPDGVVTPIGRSSSRLRFGFPLRGLILGLVAAIAVKSYLIWALGIEIYSLNIQSLLSGTAFEQIAAMVLMPDALSQWVVERYDAIYAFMQAGLAASNAA
mmetsp:Transcript_3655/g.6731  ORF Transcript_3655/g.6731 Transcript_3655/m.6731 type:complete len:130 (+) Transcript_3655:291-680(+)